MNNEEKTIHGFVILNWGTMACCGLFIAICFCSERRQLQKKKRKSKEALITMKDKKYIHKWGS